MTRIAPVLFLIIPLLGCGGAKEPDDAGTGEDTGTTTSTPTDTGTTTGTTDPTGTDTGEPLPPTYELGYNEQGKVTPSFFTAVSEGDEVPIVKGSQGAWMYVVAARTNQLPIDVKKINIEAELGPPDDPDSPYGKLKYKKRPVFDGQDGFMYLMNVYLVVPKNESWDGQEATLFLAIENSCKPEKEPDCVTFRYEQTATLQLIKVEPQ